MRNVARDITEILNRAYGDTGTSPLDRIAANQILDYLHRSGWMHPEEVAFLVDAAGGEIIVTREKLEDTSPTLTVYNDFVKDSVKFTTKKKEENG